MSIPRRILIVDDDVDVADVLKDLLSVFNFDVTVCYDSATAIDRAVESRPDVVFVDIGMPGLDGYQVIAGLRSDPRTQTIRAVAHTAWGDATTVAKAISAGFDEHAAKPIRLERLLELASNEYWEARGATA